MSPACFLEKHSPPLYCSECVQSIFFRTIVAVKTSLMQFFIFCRCCFSFCAALHLCVLLCLQFTSVYNVQSCVLHLPLHVLNTFSYKCVGVCVETQRIFMCGGWVKTCTLVHAELGISLSVNVAPVCCGATVCASHALPTGRRLAWTRFKFNSLCFSTYLDLELSCQRALFLLNACKKVSNFLSTELITALLFSNI